MTSDRKPKYSSTPLTWKPTDEMIASTIATMKMSHDNIWDAFKAVEVDVGHLYSDLENRIMSDIGNKIEEKIEEANPDLNMVQRAILLLRVRAIARKEAGLKDEINFIEREDRS